MKLRVVVIMVAFLALVAGGLTLYSWRSRPQLVELSPQADMENVPATASIRLVFSRAMDIHSIQARLVIDPAVEGIQTWEGSTLIFSPDHPWPSGMKIDVQLNAGGRASYWLSFPLGEVHWSFTTRETALAYLWPAAGLANIYTLDPVTGSIYQYTHGINVLDYSASRDGSKFYFSAGNSEGGADLYQIDRIKADGSQGTLYQAEKLLDCRLEQCRNPVVSPDGSTLAYEYLQQTMAGGPGRVQVWTLSLSNLKAKPAGQTNHETGQPAWSSTGLLAFYDWTSSGYEVINLATQETYLLTNQTGQPGSWSVDGEFYLAPEISYQQGNQSYETGNSHLLRYRIQDQSSADLSGVGAVEDVEAVYSPDGSAIAFTRKFLDAERWSLGRQIWVMGGDGSGPHAITAEQNYNHYDIAWSQDASRLAYVRFNQERIADPPELWMINADGSNPVQLVIGGYSPLWIP